MEQWKSVEFLIRKLSERQSTITVFNQYSDSNLLNNVREYFYYLLRNNTYRLLIGEAPGYNGCRLTGIPFTSEFVVKTSKHLMFNEIRDMLAIKSEVKEPTATIMWDFLGNEIPVPILWNAFPFHPHQPGIPVSNRQPNRVEMSEGLEYTRMVCDIFKPKILGALGRIGERTLKESFPDSKVVYIRHPSRGGKMKFFAGMSSFMGFHL